MILRPPRSTRTDTLFPYTTLFRSNDVRCWPTNFHTTPRAVCGVQRPRSAAVLPERSGGDDVGCNVWLGVIFQSEPFLRMHGTRAGQGYGLRHRLVHPSRNILESSEERRVGKGCVSTCWSWLSPTY